MNKEFNFNQCLKAGKKGEIDVINKIIEKYGSEYDIIDVRDKSEYRDIDIDFILKNKKDKSEISIEIKTDFTTYNNFFCELISCEERGTEGCWKKTQADYILYYFIKKGILYCLPRVQAVEVACRDCWKVGRAYDKVYTKNNETTTKTSVGARVPVSEMLKIIDFKNSFFKKEIEMI